MKLVSEEINKYCEEHSSVPSALCGELAEYTKAKVPYSGMLTGPLEGSFLGMMVRLLQVERVLEIGTFTGYSALAMAERLPNGGEVVTLDINPETSQLARSYWEKSPHGRKIKPILGPALQSMDSLDGAFDLVFIDADKTNYLPYLKKALPLVSPRGVVLVDNCLWSGKVLDPHDKSPDTQAIKDFNEYVCANKELEGTLLPLRDGVFMIRKRA